MVVGLGRSRMQQIEQSTYSLHIYVFYFFLDKVKSNILNLYSNTEAK